MIFIHKKLDSYYINIIEYNNIVYYNMLYYNMVMRGELLVVFLEKIKDKNYIYKGGNLISIIGF